MRGQSVSWKLLLSCFVCLFSGLAVGVNGRAPDYAETIAPAQPNSDAGTHSTRRTRFDCLPKDVGLNDVVSYARTSKGNVTVEKKLIQMKAQCRQGKLVDAKRREIRFFRPSCWGNPPADYLEIQQRENAELQKLKATYTVIVFGCSPMISGTPARDGVYNSLSSCSINGSGTPTRWQVTLPKSGFCSRSMTCSKLRSETA